MFQRSSTQLIRKDLVLPCDRPLFQRSYKAVVLNVGHMTPLRGAHHLPKGPHENYGKLWRGGATVTFDWATEIFTACVKLFQIKKKSRPPPPPTLHHAQHIGTDVFRCISHILFGWIWFHRSLCEASVIFYVLLTVHTGMVLVNNQLDAQFFMYIYLYSVHVSGNHVPIIGRIIVSVRHLFHVTV
jgi:hypothetical protein